MNPTSYFTRRRSVSDICCVEVEQVEKAIAMQEMSDTKTLNSQVTLLMEQEECPICLDEFDEGKAVFTAECGHKFHFACLLENVNHDEANSTKCPICRKTQTQWPEPTEGLAKAHPFCTNCGVRGTGGQFCGDCGYSLAHTPTAQERARANSSQNSRNNVIVQCPACQIRCLVSTSVRGTLQCPNGHLFQLRLPGETAPIRQPAARQIMRQCTTCYTRVQMPPGSPAGQYMCPHGHTFYYRP